MSEEKNLGKNSESVWRKNFWSGIITKISITIIIVFGISYIIIKCLETPGEIIKQIAADFTSGKVVDEFRDYVTKVEGVNRLHVAVLNSVDTFSKTDSRSILWDLINLPDVVIEIQAPVEYTYYLDLNDKWEFKWQEEDNSITIVAPDIKPGTPAVDISNMKIIEEKGSVLRDVEGVKNKLLSELSERLKQTAQEKIFLIREIARDETKKFITNWFLKVYFKDYEIKPRFQEVYFADEVLQIKGKDSFKIEKEL